VLGRPLVWDQGRRNRDQGGGRQRRVHHLGAAGPGEACPQSSAPGDRPGPSGRPRRRSAPPGLPGRDPARRRPRRCRSDPHG
jgi:hypothetical protein